MGFFGKAGDAPDYFQKFSVNFTRYSNPADRMLLLVNSDFSGYEVAKGVLDNYDQSAEKQNLIGSIQSLDESDFLFTQQKASFFQQSRIQTTRLLQYVLRNPQQAPSYIFGLVLTTFIFWYLISEYDDKHDMPLNVLLNDLFFIMMSCGNCSVSVALLHMESIQPTFVRERFGGLIDCLPFCIAMLTVNAFFDVLTGFMIAFMEYYLIEINNVLWFGAFLFGTLLAFGSGMLKR